MRHGFTTGSCAAAAAKAAAFMLFSGAEKKKIEIDTPKGEIFSADILNISIVEDHVSCAVRKDGGDDPDVTTGALIYAAVGYMPEDEGVKSPEITGEDTAGRVIIEGGEGVGRVTRPGLDQSVGEAAINSVPRAMIEKELRQVMDIFDYHGDLAVTISVPGGEKIAEKTFNPRLGIEGGISIIGTSGIVEPMSSRAIIETIRVELNQRRALGYDKVSITPGNYGLSYMKESYGFDLEQSVKCSNFIGETIDMVKELGFSDMLLTGHAGKLVKIAGGIMNTHSREADCRMEIIAAAAVRHGLPMDTISGILDCLTTEEAFALVDDAGKRKEICETLMEKIAYYLRKRAGDGLHIECIMYANDFGELGATAWAGELIEQLMSSAYK